MAKRKRNGRTSYSAGRVDESSGQRSAFPQLTESYPRDTEWRYDASEDNDVKEDRDDDFSVGDEEQEEDVEQADEEEDGEVVEVDEWEVEPHAEALAYLYAVRSEADALPSLTYVSREPAMSDSNSVSQQGNDSTEAVTEGTDGPDGSEDPWQSQFMTYYNNLRTTIATAPEPNFSQEELDVLFHINPDARPETSADEDRVWRLKTLDEPSLALLSMLDHPRTMHLLTHLRKKMGVKVRVEQCMWLVFLLARLADPGVLSGDEIDLLRRIGRKCVAVGSSLGGEDGEETVLATVDMVVCIIKYYYQQRDLDEV